MSEYRVIWVIEVEAETPMEAALEARSYMPAEGAGSEATFFEVQEVTSDEPAVMVDIDQRED